MVFNFIQGAFTKWALNSKYLMFKNYHEKIKDFSRTHKNFANFKDFSRTIQSTSEPCLIKESLIFLYDLTKKKAHTVLTCSVYLFNIF